MKTTTLPFRYYHGNSYKSPLKHLNLTVFMITTNWIVMMHFGSRATCCITQTTGYEPFPSLFSRLCLWSKHSDRDSNLELQLSLKKKEKKSCSSSTGSTHGLELYVLPKVSIWMLKLRAVGVQGGEVTAKIFDGIFLKGLSFAWEGLREEYVF